MSHVHSQSSHQINMKTSLLRQWNFWISSTGSDTFVSFTIQRQLQSLHFSDFPSHLLLWGYNDKVMAWEYPFYPFFSVHRHLIFCTLFTVVYSCNNVKFYNNLFLFLFISCSPSQVLHWISLCESTDRGHYWSDGKAS